MSEFRMPALGADMQSGVLLEWYVEPGATVHRGDIVAVVDTDKAEIEIEAFEDGTIDDLCAPKTRAAVGERLAMITPAGEAREPASADAAAGAQATVPATDGHRLRVSPLARRAAEAQHVDLAGIRGSGPEDAIVLADVERAAVQGAAPTAAPPGPPPPPSRSAAPTPRPDAPPGEAMRRTTAALMARSKREIPHFYVERTIDLAHATAWLERRNSGRRAAERTLPAAVLLAAVAQAVGHVPEMNGFVLDDEVERAEAVNVGVAIALRGGGLVAPALLDADALDVDATMRALVDLAERAKRGVLRARETTQATITVTNLGDRGADKVLGVIHPPQIAAVGFGAIRERVIAVDGMVAVRPTVVATVAADHRATDGQGASRFLARIDDYLQRLADA